MTGELKKMNFQLAARAPITPLVVMRGGAPVQIGVVSWGAGSTYDVYMKVAGHRAWIESVIEG